MFRCTNPTACVQKTIEGAAPITRLLAADGR